MSSDIDEIRWLQDRDPVTDGGADDIDVAALSAMVRGSEGAAPATTRRRGWRPRLLVGGLLAISVISAAPAVAISVWTAQTGLPVGGGTEDSGHGELVDMTAEDFPGYLRDAFDLDLPVPSGVDIEDVRVSEMQRALKVANRAQEEHGPGLVTSDIVLKEQLVVAVYCLWVDELDEATRHHDAQRAAAAQQVIVDAPDWDAVSEPGSTGAGATVRDSFRAAARRAEAGVTNLYWYVPKWVGGGCVEGRYLESFRG